MDLKKLKKDMKKLNKVSDKLKAQQASKRRKVDKRFFRATKDSNGNVNAVIRFLPQQDFDKVPFVTKYRHYIKKGKAFGCVCSDDRETCPICDYVQPLWDDYFAELDLNDRNKEHPDVLKAKHLAIDFTNNSSDITNIMVIKDKHNSDNEGKVFLYAMPKVVAEKYKYKIGLITDDDDDDINEDVMVFHPFEGRDFQLKGKTKKTPTSTFIDYDASYFAERDSAIDDDEDKILHIINQAYDLDDFLAEDLPDENKIREDFDKFLEFLDKKTTPKQKQPQKKVEEDVVETDDADQDETYDDVDDDDLDDVSVDDMDDKDLDELFD